MTTEDKALLIIKGIKGELALGTKHYDSRAPDVIVTDVESIIMLLIAGFLTFEPIPERKRIFDKFGLPQMERD